jgi:hypothetical protein
MTVVSFNQFVSFIREFAGVSPKKVITRFTRFEKDLGITGDDGCNLLRKTEQQFGIQLSCEIHGYKQTFKLKPNEYLFHTEGFDILGFFHKYSIREFMVGELYDAVYSASTQGSNNEL